RVLPPCDFCRIGQDARLLQAVCDEEQADVFVSSYYTFPLSTPSLFLAYDMIPEVMGFAPSVHWTRKRLAILQASRHAAISHSTAADLSRLFPFINPDAITVAHCGVIKHKTPLGPEATDRFCREHGIGRPYFLFVGERCSINGYKNALL